MYLPLLRDEQIKTLVVHYREQDYDYTELLCRNYMSGDPVCAEYWFIMGMIAKKKGDQNLAEEYLEQAFKLKKNPIPTGFVE